MSTTAAQLMLDLGIMLQEDGWTANGIWDETEILGYINTVCKDFILRSEILKSVFPVASVTSQRLYDNPSASMQMDRIAFGSKALYRTNRYLLDRENPQWKTRAGIPRQYHQDQLPTKTFETDRAPTSAMTGAGYAASLPAAGRGGLLRTMTGAVTYTATLPATGRGGLLRVIYGPIAYNATGTGVLRRMFSGQSNFEVIATTLPEDRTSVTDNLPVPDFCVLYLKFGVLKKMLEKEGEGQDLVRAKYCGARYDGGIQLFRRLMDGKAMVPTAGGKR